jgi:lycopene cyclase domain-containing protein
MTYSALSILAVMSALFLDLVWARTKLVLRAGFWTSYLIILPFQLLTNWWLTSRQIVMYNENAILGWRIASAPIEDLLYGFALILSVLSLWIYQGARNR